MLEKGLPDFRNLVNCAARKLMFLFGCFLLLLGLGLLGRFLLLLGLGLLLRLSAVCYGLSMGTVVRLAKLSNCCDPFSACACDSRLLGLFGNNHDFKTSCLLYLVASFARNEKCRF